jgi:hypothetical protein
MRGLRRTLMKNRERLRWPGFPILACCDVFCFSCQLLQAVVDDDDDDEAAVERTIQHTAVFA